MITELRKRNFDNIPLQLIHRWERKQQLTMSLLKMKRRYNFSHDSRFVLLVALYLATAIPFVMFANYVAQQIYSTYPQKLTFNRASIVCFLFAILLNTIFYIISYDKFKKFLKTRMLKYEKTLSLFFDDVDTLEVTSIAVHDTSFPHIEEYYKKSFIPPFLCTMFNCEQRLVSSQKYDVNDVNNVNLFTKHFTSLCRKADKIFTAAEHFTLNLGDRKQLHQDFRNRFLHTDHGNYSTWNV